MTPFALLAALHAAPAHADPGAQVFLAHAPYLPGVIVEGEQGLSPGRKPGTDLLLSVYVCNIGTAPTGEFEVEFLLSAGPNESDEKVRLRADVPSLKPTSGNVVACTQSRVKVDVSFVTRLAAGETDGQTDWTLSAQVDPENQSRSAVMPVWTVELTNIIVSK